MIHIYKYFSVFFHFHGRSRNIFKNSQKFLLILWIHKKIYSILLKHVDRYLEQLNIGVDILESIAQTASALGDSNSKEDYKNKFLERFAVNVLNKSRTSFSNEDKILYNKNIDGAMNVIDANMKEILKIQQTGKNMKLISIYDK